MGGCAVVRLEMLSVVRKDEVMTKKAIVSKAASCMKEWLRLGAPNGPRQSMLVLGSVKFQWGWEAGGMDC